MIPYYPSNEDDMDIGYKVESLGEKRVAEYLNISILEVDELDYVEYLFFLREAFIYNCSQTEDGREYLKNAKRLEETSIDREQLRNNFGKKNKNL